MACACGAATACAACWQAWPPACELPASQLSRASCDRRQSGAVERLCSGPPGGVARAVLALAPTLSCDVFGSHVVQCALAAVGRGLAGATPPPHLVAAVGAASDALLAGSAFTAVAADACGTHVARSLLLLLAGRCPARGSNKKKAAKRGGAHEDAWPAAAAFAVPPALCACLLRAAEAATDALRARGARLSCDAHAAPVLATLLRALAAAELDDALQKLIAALTLPDAASSVRVLAASAAGSRVLEAALAAAPGEAYELLLRGGVLPNAPAWLDGTAGRAPGADVVQRPSMSFILAADGSARAFKPDHDESQWWCRRDAHARIAAAALWCAGAESCALLYANASAMVMGPAVRDRCAVPTEAALVALWRDAAAGKRVPGVRAWRPPADVSEEEQLEAAFAQLLAPVAGRACVCLLHEDFAAELPLWGRLPPPGPDAPTHVVFVGGAVRDLTPQEQAACIAAAEARGFAVVGANLGRVPEFSSKVVAALGTHHANGRVLPAVAALTRRASLEQLPPAPPRRARAPTALRLVLRAPFAAGELTAAPASREALQPTLRALVAALWRSRLADEEARRGGDAPDLACHVTLCFADGVALMLGPDLVARLAAAHAAAPSEQQVLAALEAEVAGAPLPQTEDALSDALASPGLAAVLELQLAETGPACANLAAAAYADRCACAGGAPAAGRRGDVLAFLGCEAPEGCPEVLRARITPPGTAASSAAAAVFLQQLHYHGRLAPALALAQAAGPAAYDAVAPVVAEAPPVARGASITARFVLAAAMDAAHSEAQLGALVACVADAGLTPRDAAAAAVFAAAARSARRLDACYDAVAAALFAGRDASGLWRALLCGGSPDGEPCEAGAALLSELMHFPPAACTAPLRAGFRALLRPAGVPALHAWAQHADGSRALEAALRPSCAALPPRLRRRAVRALLQAGPRLQPLCLHPKASWVVAALWDALQGGRKAGRRAALRAAFHSQLAAVPSLRAANPRLWQRCGLGDEPINDAV